LVAIVTGTGDDLADATAAAFRHEGAIVVPAPRDAEPTSFMAATMRAQGRVDVLYAPGIERVVAWCDAGAHAMAASGGGSIVLTVTTRALSGDVEGIEEAAAGAAAIASARSIATAFGKRSVRVNTIVAPPGDIPDEVLLRSTLVSRTVQPHDVASLAVFLASTDAAFVTGQVVRCDGGLLAHLPHYASLLDAQTTTRRRSDT
jgi:NAD(P)-dependent dehydrogenase (short-subunit alcohol dehydrogenase family)